MIPLGQSNGPISMVLQVMILERVLLLTVQVTSMLLVDTSGNFYVNVNAGSSDVFLMKLNSSGTNSIKKSERLLYIAAMDLTPLELFFILC